MFGFAGEIVKRVGGGGGGVVAPEPVRLLRTLSRARIRAGVNRPLGELGGSAPESVTLGARPELGVSPARPEGQSSANSPAA